MVGTVILMVGFLLRYEVARGKLRGTGLEDDSTLFIVVVHK